MRTVLAIFIFSMRVFFATLVSAVLTAIIASMLLRGEIGDMAALALLALTPCYILVVVASAVEQHISRGRQPRSFGRRAVRIAPTFLVLSFMALLVLFLVEGTFSVADSADLLSMTALISIAVTIWAMVYWSIYTLSESVFEIPQGALQGRILPR